MSKLNSDRVVSCLAKSGTIRAAAIINTLSAKTAQDKHNLTLLPAFLLSKQLAAASMLAVFLKGEERIILEAEGNGPVKRVYAEAIQVGEVRGFVNYENDYNLETMKNIGEAIGPGLYKVRKILANKSEPVVGVVELFKGNISEDLAYYFAQSEQIPSAVIIDTVFNEDNQITLSAGLIIQAMPGATQKELEDLQSHLESLDFRDIIRNSEKSEDILKNSLPFDFDILKRDRIDFFCRCSKNKFMDKLITLNLKEIEEMKEHNQNELVCHYCNSHYFLDENDFQSIINRIQVKLN